MTEYTSRAGRPAETAGVAEWTAHEWAFDTPLDVAVFRKAFCQQGRVEAIVKRGLDLVLSALLLVILSPLVLIIAIVLAVHFRHNPLFAHERVGQSAVLFSCLKFRTMRDPRPGEEDVKHPSFKAGTDVRTTRLSHWVRRMSLDELPQLLNVLMGDMSIVGPRPIVPEELRMYYGPMAPVLLISKPGMTGLWAAYGRSDIEYPDRAHIELSYVTRMSLWLDIRILVKTLFAVATGRGAL